MATDSNAARDSAEETLRGRGNEVQVQQQRRSEAVSLRLAGMSYEQIGERLGISGNAAEQMIGRALDRNEVRSVSQLRAEENARLDRAQMAIWGKVIEGDIKAIGTFLQISAARSKMNGLYAPTQVQVSMTIRQEMEEALQSLETLVLGESQYAQSDPVGPNGPMRLEEARDVTDAGHSAPPVP
jgi:DNA-binding CsgD family transcriptional regulator